MIENMGVICIYVYQAKKTFYLFLESENENLYKEPFSGDSIIPFTKNYQDLLATYPRLNKVKGYIAELECGDMLFIPKNCWHYVEYQSPSAAACFTFYQKVSLQFLEAIKGMCYKGYDQVFKIRHKPVLSQEIN